MFNDLEAGASNTATVWSHNFLGNRPTNVVEKGWRSWDNVLSDYFVQNASFLKCENITLGYSFENLFKDNKYEGVNGRVYVTASNVFTLTKYKGIDPEVYNADKKAYGIDNNIYPRPFSIVAGVTLNF